AVPGHVRVLARLAPLRLVFAPLVLALHDDRLGGRAVGDLGARWTRGDAALRPVVIAVQRLRVRVEEQLVRVEAVARGVDVGLEADDRARIPGRVVLPVRTPGAVAVVL